MKKNSILVTGLLIATLLVGLPATAQEALPDKYGPQADIRLLIAINRLQLSTEQMEQIQHILVGFLDQANGIAEEKEAFAQQMLLFSGDTEELDLLLSSHKERMKSALSELKEIGQQAVDEIKGILTITQGEALMGYLSPLRMIGGEAAERQPLALKQAPRNGRGSAIRERMPGRMSELMENRPLIEERLRESLSARGEPRLGVLRMDGVKGPIARLQQIVEILDTKLSYVE